MEFIEEDSRPRFLFQARSPLTSAPLPETQKISKLHAACCFSASAVLFTTVFLLNSSSSILFTILLWISLSLIVAPFAPPSNTGGDPRVGRGGPLPSLPKQTEPEETRRRPASRWNPKPTIPSLSPVGSLNPKPVEKRGEDPAGHEGETATKESNRLEEWTVEDFEILKRQISKHPAGAPGRWERVAEAFKGRHGVESVIRAAKSLAERRSPGDDSFAQFLKQRKPLDKRVDALNADSSGSGIGGDSVVVGNEGWSSAEDIALLNALKAFPKDVAMRWEKVAAAVPGKSKGECMRRMAELKREFRSSKTSDS
ncbi:dnaJ homolog subfamily C member 2 [Phalaenopsis equestris]|uniref:dnaJ homolog subfamily C member 2 n=1 Tax=Phalaenopsis equestris TaxID=78828 RepID=UPI0009E45730|nr:dnaJ homolog subfamily C member 2 [Phalaenopsis equestris]